MRAELCATSYHERPVQFTIPARAPSAAEADGDVSFSTIWNFDLSIALNE